MLRRACIGIAFRLHRYSVPLHRYSVPLHRYSVPPPRSNTLSHKDFSGVFSRLPFFYLSSTKAGAVNNCGAYTCAGCVNNSPPLWGGRKKKPPRSSRGAAPPLSSRLRRSRTRPPRGGEAPPATRLPPPLCQPRKEVPLPPSFNRMTNGVSSCCAIKGIFFYHVSFTDLYFYIRYLPPSYHVLRIQALVALIAL
jgi:hypothetical protein